MSSMQTESEKVTHLKGTPANPARDPKKLLAAGNKGSIGDKALMDAVVIVALCWIGLIGLWVSLRHHNV